MNNTQIISVFNFVDISREKREVGRLILLVPLQRPKDCHEVHITD